MRGVSVEVLSGSPLCGVVSCLVTRWLWMRVLIRELAKLIAKVILVLALANDLFIAFLIRLFVLVESTTLLSAIFFSRLLTCVTSTFPSVILSISRMRRLISSGEGSVCVLESNSVLSGR